MQWSITCLVRLTYVFMALPAIGVNLAWCLLSYRVALSRMASSILFVHILTGLASSIVASISLRPLVTPRLTLSYLATLRLRHLQLLVLAGGKCVSVGARTMVAMRGDCFYSDGPPPTQGWRSQNQCCTSVLLCGPINPSLVHGIRMRAPVAGNDLPMAFIAGSFPLP